MGFAPRMLSQTGAPPTAAGLEAAMRLSAQGEQWQSVLTLRRLLPAGAPRSRAVEDLAFAASDRIAEEALGDDEDVAAVARRVASSLSAAARVAGAFAPPALQAGRGSRG